MSKLPETDLERWSKQETASDFDKAYCFAIGFEFCRMLALEAAEQATTWDELFERLKGMGNGISKRSIGAERGGGTGNGRSGDVGNLPRA